MKRTLKFTYHPDKKQWRSPNGDYCVWLHGRPREDAPRWAASYHPDAKTETLLTDWAASRSEAFDTCEAHLLDRQAAVEIVWTTNKHGLVGNVTFFVYWWDSCRSKDSKVSPYALHCFLPGVKNFIGNFEEESAKQAAQDVLNRWLARTGLRKK